MVVQTQQGTIPTPEYLNELMSGYAVTKIIGAGGMGAIYHAVQDVFNKEVAIKLVLSHAMQAPELVKQFQAEAQSMSILEHENIIMNKH